MTKPEPKTKRTPHSTQYRYAAETIAAANKLPIGTVQEGAHKLGMEYGEPLIVMMDCLVKYAEAYKDRNGQVLAADGVLGDLWLNAARSVRGLLNGDGVIAMRRNISTDTKDNGAIESMFWDGMGIAGYSEQDLT